MTRQHLTLTSPASRGALSLIEQNPGIATAEIALIGGWSVFHIRNVLRFLRRAGKVTSKRPMSNGECLWWIGGAVVPPKPPKVKPEPARLGPNSVFALGAT